MHAAYNIKKIKRDTAAVIYLAIDRSTLLKEENKIDGGLI
jgi:hypothetical protein